MRAEGRIVGVGASAGGLESLEQLFAAMPADTGMAFVVVQHLSPDFRSLMDELIARHSDMPVRIADDGMAVEANHIYVMPPRKEMIIRDRHLWLADKEPHTFSLPIDAFFRSLAQDVGPQAVACVLSGTGTDGSRGIVEVKRAGGLVLVETAASAKFDGMPLAALATGVVDHVHTRAISHGCSVGCRRSSRHRRPRCSARIRRWTRCSACSATTSGSTSRSTR